jgi:hypothetical protein
MGGSWPCVGAQLSTHSAGWQELCLLPTCRWCWCNHRWCWCNHRATTARLCRRPLPDSMRSPLLTLRSTRCCCCVPCSGGPVLDSSGSLIGVSTAIFTNTGNCGLHVCHFVAAVHAVAGRLCTQAFLAAQPHYSQRRSTHHHAAPATAAPSPCCPASPRQVSVRASALPSQ